MNAHTPAISTASLGKTYPKGVRGLSGLDLTIHTGEVFGLLGPNGAGKTTTVRLLNGTLEATEGSADIFGKPSTDMANKYRTATLAENAKMYEHMSAEKNLLFFASMYGMTDPRPRVSSLLERMGLSERRHDKVGTYSTGMKKRLQLARILLHEPELIFLDEPTSGLDPDAARQVVELIRKLAQDEGTTVVLCTHNLPIAEKVCDIFGFLSNGRLIASGGKEALIKALGGQLTVDVVTQRGRETIAISSANEINTHLRRIMDSGGNIVEVTSNEPDLEALYFSYVGRNHHELE